MKITNLSASKSTVIIVTPSPDEKRLRIKQYDAETRHGVPKMTLKELKQHYKLVQAKTNNTYVKPSNHID